MKYTQESILKKWYASQKVFKKKSINVWIEVH